MVYKRAYTPKVDNMKKNNLGIYISIFIFTFAFLIFSNFISDDVDAFTIDEINAIVEDTPCPELPILTSNDAVYFVLHHNGVIESIRKAQNHFNYNGWKIKSEQNKGIWNVHINSKGCMIMLICDFTFNEMGSISNKRIRYNK